MSFGKAPREQYHFTGSDDPTAPDYVKSVSAPPSRAQRDAARAAREAQNSRRAGLPKVPLKVEKNYARVGKCQRDLFAVNGAYAMGYQPGEQRRGKEDHPLMKFDRPISLKPRGRYCGDDGELAKITAIPYNAEECAAERGIALKCGRASKEANLGFGYGIIGGE
eukprot:TRINITY_DN82511_c0_g1_i1.p1 TRINITY_DN82511_c0_g1~~TRINITY_DN82511_c0_g1_i1.p1  ORF type:complete len:165 (-),score=39.05 TRINITY_DN82511_c0_g1_i1:232-726(-)